MSNQPQLLRRRATYSTPPTPATSTVSYLQPGYRSGPSQRHRCGAIDLAIKMQVRKDTTKQTPALRLRPSSQLKDIFLPLDCGDGDRCILQRSKVWRLVFSWMKEHYTESSLGSGRIPWTWRIRVTPATDGAKSIAVRCLHREKGASASSPHRRASCGAGARWAFWLAGHAGNAIGGKLVLWSEQAGTELELHIPATAAYTTVTKRTWIAESLARK